MAMTAMTARIVVADDGDGDAGDDDRDGDNAGLGCLRCLRGRWFG